jgi:hypothetical protein
MGRPKEQADEKNEIHPEKQSRTAGLKRLEHRKESDPQGVGEEVAGISHVREKNSAKKIDRDGWFHTRVFVR